jgi:hypothetical protein
LVLRKAEELAGFVLSRTARWPKGLRFTLTRRLEDLVIDVVDQLVVARYRRDGRAQRLDAINLALERARFLLRLAHAARHCPARHFEGTVQRLDEVGRMLHGWRRHVHGEGGKQP